MVAFPDPSQPFIADAGTPAHRLHRVHWSGECGPCHGLHAIRWEALVAAGDAGFPGEVEAVLLPVEGDPGTGAALLLRPVLG